MRIVALVPVLALAACAPPTEAPVPAGGGNQEACIGDACDSGGGDAPYAGGYPKDACRFDVEGTGFEPGEVLTNITAMNQYGEMMSVHDFCDHVVFLVFAAFF